MNKHVLMIGVAAAALGIFPAVAVAAASESTSATADTHGEVTEVIVTAQKRSERLLDVPMSVASISAAQLSSGGAKTTDDLRQMTPGLLTVNNGFGFLPVIRGIQSSGTSPGDATNVAIYLDDVSIGAPIAGFFDLSDIERIEVLKGPQGTLFGRNATGGAIRIITRTPSFTPGGSVAADYGFRYQELKLNGYFTGPITDSLAASFSGSYRRGAGYIKGIGPNVGRTYGAPDNYLVRGKLLFKPTNNFKAVLTADTWAQQNNSVFISEVLGSILPYPGSIPSRINTYAGSTQPIANLRGSGVSLDVNWNPSNDVTVRSITGYRHVAVNSQSDTDRTNQSISWNQLSQYENAFSEEINISGGAAKPLAWIAGAYFFDGSAGNPYFRQGTGDAPGGTLVSNFTNHVSDVAVAGFGELTWSPTSQLHITGGLRYSSERKHFHYQTLASSGTFATTDTQKTWPSVTYRGVVRYDLSDEANVYASISNGFKSGVYNAYSPLAVPVNPEKVTAYEIGAKARIKGVTLTAAAYAYQYDDIQVSAYVTVNGQLLVSLSNAASAEMRGFEFTAEGKIAEGLYFNAGVSWEPVSKYDKYLTAQVVAPIAGAPGPIVAQVIVPYDASGSHTVRTPDVTANLQLRYEHELAGGMFNATFNGSYTGTFYWQPGNFSRESPSFIANTRLSWTDKRRVTYSVFCTNLTNELYHTDYVANTRGGDSVKFPQGREAGLGISLDF
ncbi:MAG TPA: TonB-dependent receptor [Caulobacteraceae bacterium]